MSSPSSQSTTASVSTAPSTPPESTKAPQHFRKSLSLREKQQRTWRPNFHVQPRSGWLNDPCAPGYDPHTGLYHVSFQWNPSSPDWGDICWGSAFSPDMVHWTVRDEPILSPDVEYDQKGVFTGCSINGGDGNLTYAYTSVSALPIHHTLPHPAGCESLSLARSCDGGQTWQKLAANPVLPCEPDGLDVTGWRDPYVSRWPSMARTLDLDQDQTLFGLISGGIRDVTPTTFLYAIKADDLTSWRYLGPLVDFGLNLRPSRWSGDLGRNWEVTNFTTLQDETDPSVQRDFLIMGTEGCNEDESSAELPLARPVRDQLWMSGTLRKQDGSQDLRMSYNFGGHLDHGSLYAANSFFDAEIQKPVVWGWIPEDDLCDEFRHAQGWSGLLSMPRELRMQTLDHVVRAFASPLVDITSVEATKDCYDSYTLRTLASEPLQRLVQSLRAGPSVRHSQIGRRRLGSAQTSNKVSELELRSDTWELRCSIKVSPECRKVGLQVDHGEDRSTTLSFDPSNETFWIYRPRLAGMTPAASSQMISSRPEKAPHTLFIQRDPHSGVEEMETLDICAWRDKSVLEVFVNGRTAISTRLYAADETFGLSFFAEDRGVPSTELVSAEVWDGVGLA